MKNVSRLPRLYGELSSWWPILSAPEDYAEEAQFYRRLIVSECSNPPETLLELACGGGNNASHLKKYFRMTLVDLSPDMLVVSHSLNPECEHIQGDMRTVRLGQQFDAVFIHDGIVYMTSERDLRQAIETAYVHCKPGGVALFAPDHTRETFRSSTKHGGHDSRDWSMRYLEWTWDPDPGDTTYFTDFAYLLRDADGQVRCEYDRHLCGLFGQQDWLRIISEAGFRARAVPFEHSEIELGSCEVFTGLKPPAKSQQEGWMSNTLCSTLSSILTDTGEIEKQECCACCKRRELINAKSQRCGSDLVCRGAGTTRYKLPPTL
ncbi:class I SAM-dependent methyltransferase [Dehalococcoidia bacterium]|nr:class I SAM-dependent methyltransferase [Dehalococcoidia bacterium]